jgi:hypothetical protein
LTTATIDLIDMITVTAGPIVAMITRMDVITVVTTAAIIDATTIVSTIATTGVTTARVIAV